MMGQIAIQVYGSFDHQAKKFNAAKHGHAQAVAEAITWLSEEVLPKAIVRDHRLHGEGHEPSGGWDPAVDATLTPVNLRADQLVEGPGDGR